VSTLTFGTWAILPLSVALRDLKDADHLTITRRRNGPRVEMLLIEAVMPDGTPVETAVYEPEVHVSVPASRRGSACSNSITTVTTNRCDKPGCESRVTSPCLVGLGGMVAFYCSLHKPVSNQDSSST